MPMLLTGSAAAAALILCLLAGTITHATAPPGETGAPAPTATLPTQPPPTTAAPSTVIQNPPTVSAPQHLDYPAASASVAVLPLTPTQADLAARSLDPPATKDAYWLTNYGQPGSGSTDTTYIVSHRWVGVDAPFNRIGEQAKAGDTLTLTTASGMLPYRVITVSDYSKSALSSSSIWDSVPGRLVLITCNVNDPWGKNTVISADPVG